MGPRVAAVHTFPSATHHQLLQLWQAVLQLVAGGSHQPLPPRPAMRAP